jgi:hypothetical protein
MCCQASSLPYDKLAMLAMQNPAGVVAHAKIRAGRPRCAPSDAFHDSWTALGSPRPPDHQAERRPSLLPTWPLCSAGTAGVSELSRRLLRTELSELLQRPRLNTADPRYRNLKDPGGVGVGSRLSIGKAEPKL